MTAVHGPVDFWRLSCPLLLSHHENARITDASYRGRPSGSQNLGLPARLSNSEKLSQYWSSSVKLNSREKANLDGDLKYLLDCLGRKFNGLV